VIYRPPQADESTSSSVALSVVHLHPTTALETNSFVSQQPERHHLNQRKNSKVLPLELSQRWCVEEMETSQPKTQDQRDADYSRKAQNVVLEPEPKSAA
jgi:hypothetical protein